MSEQNRLRGERSAQDARTLTYILVPLEVRHYSRGQMNQITEANKIGEEPGGDFTGLATLARCVTRLTAFVSPAPGPRLVRLRTFMLCF